MKTKIVSIITSAAISTLFFACAQTANIKTVNPQEFQNYITQKNTILIDVRTPEEVSEGKIENATNINLYDPDFENKISKLDKSKTVLVYCRSGHRSMEAAKIMTKKGYKVINLNGGITNWQAQGLPIKK